MERSVQKNDEKTFFIYSMSCPRRSMDSNMCDRYLRENGYTTATSVESAALIIVSTCAYHDAPEDQSVHAVQTLRRTNPHALMIVTGCLPKINPDRLKELTGVVTLGPNDLGQLDRIIHADVRFSDIPDSNMGVFRNSPVPELFDMKTTGDRLSMKVSLNRIISKKKSSGVIRNVPLDRGYDPSETFAIRISKGCYGNCTYCAIKNAVGTLKSKPVNHILSEFEAGLEQGYRRFVLIGDDTGGYGMDCGTNIPELLEKLFAYDGEHKFIIKDFNFHWLNRYFEQLKALFMKNIRLIDFLIFPVQSGSDKILTLMNRPYNATSLKTCFGGIKEDIPELRLDTAMMVGFPGENEEDFRHTLDLVENIGFDHIWIYEYTDRPGTKASMMGSKVPAEEIQRRSRILLETQERILRNA